MSNDPIDNGSKAGQPPRRPRIIACNQKARQLAAMGADLVVDPLVP